MYIQSLRDVFLKDSANRGRSMRRDRMITPQPGGTHAKLWLDKYLSFQERKDEGQTLTQPEQARSQQEEENSRLQLIREVSALPIPPIYEEFYQRWVQNLDTFGARYHEWRAKGRMIVGLGAESVLETAIALHHTYGVPYIPGSALKGLAASYLRWQSGEKWQEDAVKRQQYKILFGNTDEAGFITFFDAFYIPGKQQKGRPLQQDVITVHHPDYYKELKKAQERGKPDKLAVPSDWDNPNPIFLLSATGYYLIALAAPDLQEPEPWIKAAFDILDNALLHWGIGAKTFSGYGRMIRTSEETQETLHISSEAQSCIDNINRIPSAYFNQRINNTYKDWQKFVLVEDRVVIAKAIVKCIELEGYTQAKSKKDWYQELVRYIQEHPLGENRSSTVKKEE